MKVTKEPVEEFELYVISERQPLQPSYISYPATGAAFHQPAPGGVGSAAPAPQGPAPAPASGEVGCSLVPLPQATEAAEQQAAERLLGTQCWTAAAGAAACLLAAKLTAGDKLACAMELMRKASSSCRTWLPPQPPAVCSARAWLCCASPQPEKREMSSVLEPPWCRWWSLGCMCLRTGPGTR